MKSRAPCRIFKSVAVPCVVGLCLSLAHAEEGRDPTRAPTESSTGAGGASASPWGGEGMTVLVRDGKPLLVVGTRLYAQGDKVGQARITRNTEV